MVERQLRVLHVTEALGGGIYTLLLQLVRRQADAGAAVSIAFVLRSEAPPLEQVTREFDPRVRLIPIHAEGGIGARTRATYSVTRRELASQDFDIIHLHCAFAGVVGACAALRTRTPSIYRPHGWSFLRSSDHVAVRRVYQAVEAAQGRTSGLALFCRSELETGQQMLHPRHAYLLPTGVDVSHLLEPRSVGAHGIPTVAMIGRIAYQKAPWRFAAIARILHGQARFVWCGDGPAADRERWIGDAPVDVLGWLTPEQLRLQLHRTTVLLFPTLWEGLPMAVMEAQAQGVPVVTSDAVGNRDAVLDGKTGFIAATEEQMVAATARLIGEVDLREQMSRSAQEFAQSSLTDARLGEDSLNLYRRHLQAVGAHHAG